MLGALDDSASASDAGSAEGGQVQEDPGTFGELVQDEDIKPEEDDQSGGLAG